MAWLRQRSGQTVEEFAKQYADANVRLVELWEKGYIDQKWDAAACERGPRNSELDAMRQTARYYRIADALRVGPLRSRFEQLAKEHPKLAGAFECAFEEAALNGTPIDWSRMARRTNFSPREAAQLAYRVYPFSSDHDLTDSQLLERKRLEAAINDLAHELSGLEDAWDLRRLLAHLGNNAPTEMLRAVAAAVDDAESFLSQDASLKLVEKSDALASTLGPRHDGHGSTSSAAGPTRVVHKLATRRDALAPLIQKLMRAAQGSDRENDTSALWNELRDLASRPDPPPPLLGYSAGKVQYQTDSNETGVAYHSRQNFADRVRRYRKLLRTH